MHGKAPHMIFRSTGCEKKNKRWRAALAGSPLLEVFEAALLDDSRAIAPGCACSTPAPLLDLRSDGFRAWVMTRRTAVLPLFQFLLCGPSCLLLFHSATPGTPPAPRPENWVDRWGCLGKPPSVRASSLGSMVGAPCWAVVGGRIQLAFTQLFAVPAMLKRVTLLEDEALPEADSVPPPQTPPPSLPEKNSVCGCSCGVFARCWCCARCPGVVVVCFHFPSVRRSLFPCSLCFFLVAAFKKKERKGKKGGPAQGLVNTILKTTQDEPT